MRLENKVAVVTGAAKGLGGAMAQLFAAEGAKVIGVDMAELSYANENVEYYALNVTDTEACRTFVDYVMKKYGRIGKETLAYLDRGRGETVLLLHGNMSSSLHFTPLFERLAAGFRLVAPDLRGFGDSTYHEPFDSLGELAEDVYLFMEALDIPSAFVVGWSTGGGIALEQSALWIPETLKQRCLMDLDWALASFNMSQEEGPYGPGDGSIQKVACPCAFTSGDKDMVVPPYMVQENVSALGDKGRLIAYENCGHSPLVDCPDQLAEDIRSFFKE